MSAIEKENGILDMNRKNTVDTDLNKLKHHMKLLELKIKKLRAIVLINRELVTMR
jgi:hypothetical protein